AATNFPLDTTPFQPKKQHRSSSSSPMEEDEDLSPEGFDLEYVVEKASENVGTVNVWDDLGLKEGDIAPKIQKIQLRQ
ncbi:hypothetical protein Tco_1536956, partial [Tanacetum coccineum]